MREQALPRRAQRAPASGSLNFYARGGLHIAGGLSTFAAVFTKGEMSEWFKERAWKVRIRQKRIRGSNPRLSAQRIEGN